MPVSQTAEYALRAVVWLAQNPKEPQTTQQISIGTQVSVSYLPKVLQPLGRAGILTSQRGINGGYTLERPPDNLTVLEVIRWVDPVERIKSCPLKLATHSDVLCPLHSLLDAGIADIHKRFGDTKIGDLLRSETGLKPLCETTTRTFDLSPKVEKEE